MENQLITPQIIFNAMHGASHAASHAAPALPAPTSSDEPDDSALDAALDATDNAPDDEPEHLDDASDSAPALPAMAPAKPLALSDDGIRAEIKNRYKRPPKTAQILADLTDAGFYLTDFRINRALGRANKIYTPNTDMGAITPNKRALLDFCKPHAPGMTDSQILAAMGYAFKPEPALARVLAALASTPWPWPTSDQSDEPSDEPDNEPGDENTDDPETTLEPETPATSD